MTDRVQPSPGTVVDSLEYSGAIRYAAGTDGWVVPSGEDKFAGQAEEISGAPLNGFPEDHSTSSLTVTIGTGEGFVAGKWVARDVTTDVTLVENTDNQTVYLGWAHTGSSVIIGLEGDFPADHSKYSLWDFRTDGSGVIEVDNLRDQSYGIDSADHANTADKADTADTVGDLSPSQLLQSGRDETIGGSLTVEGTVSIEGQSISLMEASGSSGLEMGDGTIYSTYQGWTTAYSYSGDGGEGFRVRNPDGPGDLFNVPTGGGSPNVQGDDVWTEDNIHYSDSEPSGWSDGDLWCKPTE